METVKTNLVYILLGIIVILFLFSLKQCSSNSELKNTAEQFDRTISALNDSIKKVVNTQGDTVFREKVVDYNLDDLVKTEAFKSLNKDKQTFYLNLEKTKGLLASAQATIESQAQIINQTKYNDTVEENNSTICYNIGSKVTISDSVASLNFRHTLTFGKNLTSDLKYTYKTDIQTTYIRNKDKTITIDYKLNDPNAVVLKAQSFIIPEEEEQTKFQKVVQKVGKWLIPSVAAAAGGYSGYKLR